MSVDATMPPSVPGFDEPPDVEIAARQDAVVAGRVDAGVLALPMGLPQSSEQSTWKNDGAYVPCDGGVQLRLTAPSPPEAVALVTGSGPCVRSDSVNEQVASGLLGSVKRKT